MRKKSASGLADRRLWIIVCAGFAIRCVWLSRYVQVIENEGADYARLARNLLSGNGYVGMLGGPETIFPPLYPMLIGNVITRRIHQGMGYSEATRGLGPKGEAEGAHLYSDQFEILKKETGGGRTLFNSIARDFQLRLSILGWKAATLIVLGSPILAVLALVGFLTTSMGKRKFLLEGFLLSIAAGCLLVLLSIGVMWPRYLFPLALLLVPWAGAGVSRISSWIQERVEGPSGGKSFLSGVASAAAVCLMLAGVVIPSVGAVLETDEFSMSRFHRVVFQGPRAVHPRLDGVGHS